MSLLCAKAAPVSAPSARIKKKPATSGRRARALQPIDMESSKELCSFAGRPAPWARTREQCCCSRLMMRLSDWELEILPQPELKAKVLTWGISYFNKLFLVSK